MRHVFKTSGLFSLQWHCSYWWRLTLLKLWAALESGSPALQTQRNIVLFRLQILHLLLSFFCSHRSEWRQYLQTLEEGSKHLLLGKASRGLFPRHSEQPQEPKVPVQKKQKSPQISMWPLEGIKQQQQQQQSPKHCPNSWTRSSGWPTLSWELCTEAMKMSGTWKHKVSGW